MRHSIAVTPNIRPIEYRGKSQLFVPMPQRLNSESVLSSFRWIPFYAASQGTVKEVKSRLGNFCIVELEGTKLITPCDTRVRIIQALSQEDKTAEDLSKDIGASYSTIMDHMDLLEKVGLVEAYLKKSREEFGRRRICFKLVEK